MADVENTWLEWRQRIFAEVERFDRFMREHDERHRKDKEKDAHDKESIRLRISLLEVRAALIGAVVGLAAGGAVSGIVILITHH